MAQSRLSRKPGLHGGFLLLALVLAAAPLHAALQPHVFSGSVSVVDAEENRIRIQTEEGAFGKKAPNEHALEGLSEKDAVVAVSLGSNAERWVFIGRRIKGSDTVSDGYGDIAFLASSGVHLRGGYALQYSNTPDCSCCSGCNCAAAKARLRLQVPDSREISAILRPGEQFVHEGRTYRITVGFISGQAPAYPECEQQMCAGPQPVSNFVVSTEPVGGKDGGSGGTCFISRLF